MDNVHQNDKDKDNFLKSGYNFRAPSPYHPDCRGFVISIFHLFGIIGVVVVVAGITRTEAVAVLRTDRPTIGTSLRNDVVKHSSSVIIIPVTPPPITTIILK